jgi:hypothetical protein
LKLQLTQAQATRAASLVSFPFDPESQWDSIQAALDGMSLIGHLCFTKRDLWAVLTAMGGGDDPGASKSSGGAVLWETVNMYTSQNNIKSAKRGYYNLPSEGSIPHPGPTPPLSPVSPASPLSPVGVVQPSKAPVQVVSVPGVSWAPSDSAPASPTEGWYATDPGLRRVALESASCFGAFWEEAGQCQKCPLARFCAPESAAGDILSQIAMKLDLETTEELDRVAALGAPGISTPTLASSDDPSSSDDPPSWPKGFLKLAEVTAFALTCSGCDQTIPEKSSDIISVSELEPHQSGIYHEKCARALLLKGS